MQLPCSLLDDVCHGFPLGLGAAEQRAKFVLGASEGVDVDGLAGDLSAFGELQEDDRGCAGVELGPSGVPVARVEDGA